MVVRVTVNDGLTGELRVAAFSDDVGGKFDESKHKRAKNGQFTGKNGSSAGGKKGVNEKHFEALGVGGDHKIIPNNAKSKSLPHGMTANEYIAQKHGGDVNKGLSYLKYYHNKGDFTFEAPAKPASKSEPEVQAVKSTPLTKGKNAQHYSSLGVTQEHELHAKPSMKSIPKGMTIKEYIDKKHGGDEGKALSWLKHHEKNGDLIIKSPGGKTQVGQKPEAELIGDSTNPVTKAQVEQAQATPPKLTGPEKDKVLNAVKPKATVEEKLQALKDAKDAKTYAKFGLTPDHKVALKSTDYKGQYVHGQALKDNPHVKADLAGALKHFKNNAHKVDLVAPGQSLPEPKLSNDDFLAKYKDHVVQSLKPGQSFQDWTKIHGKKVSAGHAGQTSDSMKSIYLGQLKMGIHVGNVKLLPPGSSAPSISDSHAAHIATLSGQEQRAAKKAHLAAEGKAAQEKSFGEASYSKPAIEKTSQSQYDSLASQHLKPTGAHYTAMKAYSGSAFSDINSKLRKGQRDKLSFDQKKTVKDLEEFTNKSRLNSDMVLYRGVSTEGQNSLHRLKPGDDFAPGQFNSVSTNKSVAHSFAGGHPHIMVIRAKKGARGGFMGSASKFQHEHEVVLPHDAKLRYAGRSAEGHWIFDHVE